MTTREFGAVVEGDRVATFIVQLFQALADCIAERTFDCPVFRCRHKAAIVILVFVSSSTALKLDEMPRGPHNWHMETHATDATSSRPVANLVQHRIERGGERLWSFDDFNGLSFTAVAQALSRLTRAGAIERLSKGVYFRSRQTAFGKSRPNPTAIRNLATKRAAIFPAGIAAASLLGFTTQNPARSEVATTALSLPRKLVGADTVIHTRRPAAWARLSERDGALLDVLRNQAKWSELSPKETVKRTLTLMRQNGRYDRLLKVAHTEPPRVRAILGAIGEQLGKPAKSLRRLRASLNPLSRFDFGGAGGISLRA